MVREIPLAEFGLETTEQAGARRGQSGPAIRRLVAAGLIPALVIGRGQSARYLLRPADVDAVPVRAKGRPHGTTKGAAAEEITAPESAPKTRKTRAAKKSGKKSAKG